MKRLVLLVALALSVLPVRADTVSMDFEGVEMEIFLQWFARRSNRRIIYNHLRQGLSQQKIYLIAPEPIPEESVESICMSLLESNGFTLVRVGEGKREVYKLVETSKAASSPIAIYSQEELAKKESRDCYISQLVMIRHLKADNVLNSIRQAKLLDPSTGSIVEIKGANALIISDFMPNIQRIMRIIEMIDLPPPRTAMETVSLSYARAEDVKGKLNDLFQSRTRELAQYNTSDISPTIIADSRTNTITLRAGTDDLEQMRTLIKEYDKKIREQEVVAKLYRLKNVTPDKILPTLRDFIRTPLFVENVSPGSSTQKNVDISVIANEYTKSLLVTAPVSAHKLLADVIVELDVRRPQVILEAVICEFTPSDVFNLGIELMKLDRISDATDHTFMHGVSSFGLSSIVDQAGNPVTPKSLGVPSGRRVAPGGGLTAFMTRDGANNIPFLIRALQSITNTEVISVPRILADDGEKAEISVRQEEPVTSTDALNTSTTTTSFKEFVSAGTTLTITPYIINNKSLRLEIQQDIEAFVGGAPAAGIPPPKSSRSLKTVVTVPSGHTIVLGGLCGRREIETVDKIPILGDIPLLGLLFQSRARSVSKTNLYIFIAPRILCQPGFEDLMDVSRESRDHVRELHGISVDDPRAALERKE